ncbi:translation initiation factor IF-2 [Mycoplasmoides fastidiosum]|uniref:Translation initiation factor IF-2 n=1 Tax=Mycoplasmoides fastidiosum TaxID=92758 RepID=A0ABU0LYA6_9BACT|nr:translation initiation factor IF-2 [Mycoplasmoides fastidiosum]MDQ0513663.1 translation initiation factor IF-2 [Mycoplasmoides fastidiosum]UUD37917.1 translation initiation factor IF-2 [Mycoplasmoides fastidiosum]
MNQKKPGTKPSRSSAKPNNKKASTRPHGAKPTNSRFVGRKKPDQRTQIDVKKSFEAPQVGLKNNVFIFTSALSVNEFASKIGKHPAEVVKFLFLKGIIVTVNSILTEEQIGELCLEFGYDFEKRDAELSEESLLNSLAFDDDPADLVPRPPVVTIMGHVDHGKTSLLDQIRQTNVTESEHAGITQHIGSYQVTKNGKKITFLDTPGHEAFTKMRARGASVTDIVVLVVAADDGVKPQTIEALDHARDAGVRIIVFINKMDVPGANPDLVRSQLYDQKLVVEELGGDVPCVAGSVKQNQGIAELLELILFVAELADLKANPKRLAHGTIIESRLDKGYGPIATFLVQNGTLLKGDFLTLNSTTGKVRIMHNDQLKVIEAAGPSTPVKVAGLLDIPQAGDKFFALKDEKSAKIVYQKISEKKWKERIFNLLNTQTVTADGHKRVNIIVKTDVHGSLEAIKSSLDKLNVDKINLNIVSSNTGSINESDLQLAKISGSTIFSFNVKPTKIIRTMAESEKIMIRFHNVIYTLIDEVQQLMLGSLDPVEIETVLGEAVVRQLWRHSDVGVIAGCHVTAGKITRNAKVRVLRDGIVIYTSRIASLKHGKKDEKEILINNDCGIIIEKFQDIKENDVLEAFETKFEAQHEGLVVEEKTSKNKAKKS